MKILILVLLILILVINVSAVNIVNFEGYYTTIAPGETYQLEYSFNKMILEKEVYIIKPDKTEYKPGLIFGRLNNKDYLYFYIPENFIEGVYKLVIKGGFLDNGFLKEFIEEENFTLKTFNGVRIETPIVKLSGDEFRIKLFNLGSESINVKPLENNFSIPFRDSLELNPKDRKDLIFKVKDSYFNIDYVFIDSGLKIYKIPIVGKGIKEEKPIIDEKKPIEVKKDLIKFLTENDNIGVTIQNKESKSGFVRFMALENIENVEVILSGDIKEIVSINVSDVGVLKKDQIYNVNLIINEDRNAISGSYGGFLNILSDKGSVKMEVSVNVLGETKEPEKETPETIEEDFPFMKKNLSEVVNKKQRESVDARYLIVAFILLGIIVYVFYSISKRPLKPKGVKEVYSRFKKR